MITSVRVDVPLVAEAVVLVPLPSAELASELNRLEKAERQERDQKQQELLGRLRGLARFD